MACGQIQEYVPTESMQLYHSKYRMNLLFSTQRRYFKLFNAKTQRHKEGAAAHTEVRKGMTDVMRCAVRCVATYVQVLLHDVCHAFAYFRMRGGALFVSLRLCV